MSKKVAIIGAGPGGYVCAIRFAQLGADVTLFEKRDIGGTCLNRGCIPTKAMHKTAELYQELKHASDFGINVENYSLDPQKVLERKSGIVTTLVGGIDQLLKGNGVKLINAFAKLGKDRKISYNEGGEDKEDTFDAVIIATGSEPALPPIKGADIEGVMNSDDLLNMVEIPESMIVLGGGVVAMEFASIYQALGTEVTVVVRSAILRMVDSEIVKRATPVLKKQGMAINVKSTPKNIEKTENGFKVTYEKGGKEETVEAQHVLVAMGRKSNIENIGLEEAGVITERDYIKTDEFNKTSAEGIYAIGDVNGKSLLAHAAEHQGVAVAEYVMEGIHHREPLVPNCIFIIPEIASIGASEDEVKEQGIEYKISKFMMAANGKALSLGEPDGLVKVITDMDSKLLGVHIFGAHASDMIHEAILAIDKGMNVQDIKEVMHAHPTLPEAFYEAVLGIDGMAIHMVDKKRK